MNSPQNFVDDSAMQFALREMHRLLNRFQFWLVLLTIVGVLTVSGPFNTLVELSFLQRLAYWAGIAVLTSLPSFMIAFMINWHASRRGWPMVAPIIMASALSSIPVSLIVWGVSAFVTGNGDPTAAGLFDISLRCIPICLAITTIYTLLRRPENAAVEAAPDSALEAPPFFARLNPATGRKIISLQAQDHYVEVITTRGKEMILMRLEDAITELPNTNGIRTHRSWWVAKSGLDKLVRQSGKLSVQTVDGRLIPVSRANEKDVRAWADDM